MDKIIKLQTQKLMTVQTEEKLVDTMINHIESSKMTIANVKDVTNKVIEYMQFNAVLEDD